MIINNRFKQAILNEATPNPGTVSSQYQTSSQSSPGMNQTEFKQTVNSNLDSNTNAMDNSQIDAGTLDQDPTSTYGATPDPAFSMATAPLQVPKSDLEPEEALRLMALHTNYIDIKSIVMQMLDQVGDLKSIVVMEHQKYMLMDLHREISKTLTQINKVLNINFNAHNFDKLTKLYKIVKDKLNVLIDHHENVIKAIKTEMATPKKPA